VKSNILKWQKLHYNERSWAIDVISEINLYILQTKVGTLKVQVVKTPLASEKSSLFPDVLIFKDLVQEILFCKVGN
jgi:hypothetical protein